VGVQTESVVGIMLDRINDCSFEFLYGCESVVLGNGDGLAEG
jgi:hypothetical protein